MTFAIELMFIGGAFTVVGLAFAVIVFLIGAFALLKPSMSTVLGVTGIAFSILSLVGALGGFLFGTILGIVGGSLCVAWQPPGTEERETMPETTGATTSAGAGTDFGWEENAGPQLTESGPMADSAPQLTEATTEEQTPVQDAEETVLADTGADEETFEWNDSEPGTATGSSNLPEEEPDTSATDTESPFGSDESGDDTPTFSWEEDPHAEDK